MAKIDTFTAVKEAIIKVHGNGSLEVKTDSTFDDIGLDSLDIVEVVMEVEDKIGIEIPDESMPEDDGTIGDFIKVIDDIRNASA